jgi:hypothetical protein
VIVVVASSKLNPDKLPEWIVTVDEHEVRPPVGYKPRLIKVDELVIHAWAQTEREARRQGVHAAHIRSNVPPFRTLLRQSWNECRAMGVITSA